jgi:hypothetical protein
MTAIEHGTLKAVAFDFDVSIISRACAAESVGLRLIISVSDFRVADRRLLAAVHDAE